MNVPVPRLVELTVTVDEDPKHGEVADGDVNTFTSGWAFTLNEAVLLLDTLLLQPDVFVIDVIVSVVAPTAVSFAAGIVNVPLLTPIVSVAVSPVAVLGALRL